MAERFTRLFQLDDDLYADGSPVIICAGVLLNDTVTGKTIAQIKFQNISSKVISAAKIELCAIDAMGTPQNDNIEYLYSRLNIPPGAFWGGDKAIILPDNASASFTIRSMAVAFEDGTNWKTEEISTFSCIPASPCLSDELNELALVEQYRIETTPDAKYAPKEYGTLWRCTCGCINHGKNCTMCHTDKITAFQAYSIPALFQKAATRLEQNTKEYEKKQAEKRKTIKTAVIVLSIVAVLSIFGSVYGFWINPKIILPARKYAEAMALFQDGKYRQAETVFAELGSYRDCEQILQSIPYHIAEDFLEQGEYQAAIDAFSDLGEYQDSTKRVIEATYQYAQSLQADGDYITARNYYEKAVPYADSQLCIDKLNGLIFDTGAALFEKGSYTDALQYLKEVPATDKSIELIEQAQTALEYLRIVDILEHAEETVNSPESLSTVIETIRQYQKIAEIGKQITDTVLTEKVSHMVDMYWFYVDYVGRYKGEYDFTGSVSVELNFSNTRSEAGYFYLSVSGTLNFLSTKYMSNGSLTTEPYSLQDKSTIVYKSDGTEFVYHKSIR